MPSVQGLEEYVAEYAAEQGAEIEQPFAIDEEAVKKAKRSIRTCIKLDTGVEIKISSPTSEQQQYVERGYQNAMTQEYFLLRLFPRRLMRDYGYPLLYINVWRKMLISCARAGLRAVGVPQREES